MANQWYPHYPGDYERDTAHLSLIEHGAYRLLLDHYYSTGGPLPEDRNRLYRVCRAFNDLERAAVDAVLSQFFKPQHDGHHNGRADRQLSRMAKQKSKLSESGRRGAKVRWKATQNDVGDGQAIGQAIGHPNGLSMAKPKPEPYKAAAAACDAWKAIGLKHPAGDQGFREFWETAWLTRNGHRLSEVMGICADGWRDAGGKVPGPFFRELARIRGEEKHAPTGKLTEIVKLEAPY